MINKFAEIDLEIEEGRLLCYAMGLLMNESRYMKKNPEEVLAILKEGVKKVEEAQINFENLL